MPVAKVKQQGGVNGQESLEGTPSCRRRRRPLMSRIDRFRSNTTASQRLLDDCDDSRRALSVDDAILLNEKDVVLVNGGDSSDDAPLVQADGIQELSQLKADTETIVQRTNLLLEQATLDSSKERVPTVTQKTKRLHSWRKLSKIGLPRLAPWKKSSERVSLHSEPSSVNEDTLQDDCSHSIESEENLLGSETHETDFTLADSYHSISVNTQDASDVQVANLETMVPILKHEKKVPKATSTETSIEKRDDSGTKLPQSLYSRSLDEFASQGNSNMQNKSAIPSVTVLMESFRNPSDSLQPHSIESQENPLGNETHETDFTLAGIHHSISVNTQDASDVQVANKEKMVPILKLEKKAPQATPTEAAIEKSDDSGINGPQPLYSQSLLEFASQCDSNMQNKSAVPSATAFMEAFRNPLNSLQPKKTESVEINSSTLPVDELQNKGADASARKEISQTAQSIFAGSFHKPSSAQPFSTSDRMVITASETNVTAASSTGSVWDDVEVRPLTEDDWISFGFGSGVGNATSVTAEKVGEPAKETIQRGAVEVETENEAIPFDEEADTGASRMTPSPHRRKTFVEQIAEARMALQKSKSARQKTRTIDVTSTVSQPIESNASPLKRVTCSRIVMQFDQLKGGCSELFDACIAATVESCALLIVVGEYVLDEVSETCCNKAHEQDAQSPSKHRRARRGKRDRAPAPVTEIRVEQQPVRAVYSEDLSDFMQRSRNSVEGARRKTPKNRANRARDSLLDDAKYVHTVNVTSRRAAARERGHEVITPAPFADTAPVDVWASRFEPHDADETLLEDVDRFMIAMRPIKECQQQVSELRFDASRTKKEIAREARFWRQHEAKWKTRLPFHTGETTYATDSHFL